MQDLCREEHRVQVCEVVPGGGTVKVGRPREVRHHERRSGARRDQAEEPGDRLGLADLGEVAYVPVDDRGEVAVIPGAPRDLRSQAAYLRVAAGTDSPDVFIPRPR